MNSLVRVARRFYALFMFNAKYIETYVLHYAQKLAPAKQSHAPELLNLRYLESGLLDSFSFLEMIADFEKKFSIQFSEQHLRSKAFGTFCGVIQSIKALVAATS